MDFSKLVLPRPEIKFYDALKLFLNTCEMKFEYWVNREIMPLYLAKGIDHVTDTVVENTMKYFQTDVKASLNVEIHKKLLANYFSDVRAIDIFLKQYFYNRLDKILMNKNKINGANIATP